MLKAKLVSLVLLTSFMAFAQDSVGNGTDPKTQYAIDNNLPLPDGQNVTIIGSTLVLDSIAQSGDNVTINLHGTCVSSDVEWWDQLTVYLPDGWVINSLDVTEVEAGSLNVVPAMSGVGTNVARWTDDGYPCSGLGFLESADASNEAIFTINATAAPGPSSVDLSFTIEGDHWVGGTESVICSTTSPCVWDPCIDPATTPLAAPDVVVSGLVSVPTLTEWGFIAFLLVLMVAGTYFIRQRKAMA